MELGDVNYRDFVNHSKSKQFDSDNGNLAVTLDNFQCSLLILSRIYS